MKICLKSTYYHGYEAEGEKYFPSESECFCVNLRMFIGPQNEEGEESYDIQILTPRWMEENHEDYAVLGVNKLIVNYFDHDLIVRFLSSYISKIEGENWDEINYKLKGLGRWEFDDYS